MKRLDKIPLNKQTARAVGGLDIGYLFTEKIPGHHLMQAHRDDYYMLIILIKGEGSIQCDMEHIVAKPTGILYIRPYQIHSYEQQSNHLEGYALSIAPFLIPDHCLAIFQGTAVSQQFINLEETQERDIIDTADLMLRTFEENSTHKTFVIHGLFNALINQVASCFSEANPKQKGKQNQSQVINTGFHKLLQENSFLHPPSFFAEKLNITTSHLNDCVHAETGFSVTHWLQQAMALEAKRNLYYTSDNVKEIAYRLGFDDHAYFSRLFKKVAGLTPLAFRKKFRE